MRVATFGRGLRHSPTPFRSAKRIAPAVIAPHLVIARLSFEQLTALPVGRFLRRVFFAHFDFLGCDFTQAAGVDRAALARALILCTLETLGHRELLCVGACGFAGCVGRSLPGLGIVANDACHSKRDPLRVSEQVEAVHAVVVPTEATQDRRAQTQ